MNDKSTGSFYTPLKLVSYMVHSAMNNNITTVLEPSFGDGRFINEIVKNKETCNITGVELFREKIESYIPLSKNINLEQSDFIKYSLNCKKKYDLIIGNPPYISKKQIPHSEWGMQEKLLDYFNLPHSLFQNIWVSFVLASMKLLKKNGCIFFVLPFEFLQVQYAEKLRTYLESKFNYIEITTFRNKVFTNIEQDICLVYLTNKVNIESVIIYKTYDNINEINLISKSEICRHKPLKKWSNSILNDTETTFLMNLSKNYVKINDIGEISPGIVTGANNYFIIQKEMSDSMLSLDNSLPIISKSSYISNSLIFKSSDQKDIEQTKIPSRMINLTNTPESNFSSKLQEYLMNDLDKNNKHIKERYKCRIRKRWYDVPIIKNGDLIFFKRYDIYPRLIINRANIHTTDIAYNIRLNSKYDAPSVAFCFYNSLTLALCEYNGRFYGGGVNELVPSEFKSLYIPYKKIENKHIEKLDKMFRNSKNIEQIIAYVDRIVFDNDSSYDFDLLKSIRKRYYERRLNL